MGFARLAALEHDDVERGARAEFLGYEQAGPAAAGDDGVDAREGFHGSSSQGVTLWPATVARDFGFGRKALP